MKFLNNFFKLKEHQTSTKIESIAGVTTFLTMAYITIVNPAVLSNTGMDFGAVFVATCIAAAFGSIVMGILGNYPIAQAPGMGQNAFFTFGVVLGMEHSWQTALGAVFVSGMIFVILSVLPVRSWLVNSIPHNLKLGIAGGIGLFLGFIALKNAGISVQHDETLVTLGNVFSIEGMLFITGFVTISALNARGITGAVIIGVLITTTIAILLGEIEYIGFISMPPSLKPLFFQLDIAAVFKWSMVTVILSMLIVDVFDTAGTLTGVLTRANLLDKNGQLPNLGRALISDSSATVVGAIVGTSSTTSYIESAAGVEAGGRTGLTAVICGLLFLSCLFLSPIAQTVPTYATAAALLFVACLMSRSLADIDKEDITESAPAAVTAIAMPLTFSIAEGIGLGFISYILIKFLSGRAKECSIATYVIGLIFSLKYAFL